MISKRDKDSKVSLNNLMEKTRKASSSMTTTTTTNKQIVVTMMSQYPAINAKAYSMQKNNL